MSSAAKTRIPVSELRIGHYVDLELPWLKHPFMFSRFLITKPLEIQIIREIGLQDITIVPERSRPVPDSEAQAPPAKPAAVTEDGIAKDAYWARKQEAIARDAAFRAERQQIVTAYQQTVRKISSISRDLRSGPANTVAAAQEIVDDMLSAFERASEVLVNLVHLSDDNYTMHNHALNVTVLSVVLARYLELDADEIHAIGMGALLHDIGKTEIPAQILARQGRLSAPEEALLQTHAAKGARLAQRVQPLPPEVLAIIEQHHELLDGTGYPHGLKGNQLWLPVRIVSITNLYDNLCNPPDVANSLSPRDAMAVLYKRYAGKLDAHLVSTFIRAMGIYPPGTIVRLSNDDVGMVVSVDEAQLLRPRVVIYNPDIPHWNAMMTDLRERTDLEVREVLRPGDCPRALYEYLGISERLGYYYETR